MVEFFHGRRLRYQILACAAGRWQIVDVISDNRDQLKRDFDRRDLIELEQAVTAQAQKALLAPGVTAIRVLRERIRGDGYRIEEEFLKLQSDRPDKAASARPGYVARDADAVPLCETTDDLLGRPALRAIGQIMRPSLDDLGVTALELVTLRAGSQGLRRTDTAVTEAITATLRLQASATTEPLVSRRRALEALADAAVARVRDAGKPGNPPTIGAAGFDAYLTALGERLPVVVRRFWGLRGLAQVTDGSRSYGAKLTRLFTLEPEGLSEPALELFDNAVAAIVDQQAMLRELVGPRPDLGSHLLHLAQLASGEASPESTLAAVSILAKLLKRGLLPATGGALWERIDRSLASRQRLSDGQAAAELDMLIELRVELLSRVPGPHLPAVSQALDRRHQAARQTALDQL